MRETTCHQITYSPTQLNQYDDLTVNDGTLQSFSYDSYGNMTKTPSGTVHDKFTYDHENRLKYVEPSNPVPYESYKYEYTYDYLGRRAVKTIYVYTDGNDWVHASPSSGSNYIYDGWNILMENEMVFGTEAVKYYGWGLDLSGTLGGAGGIGGYLGYSDWEGDKVKVALRDAGGNVTGLFDMDSEEVVGYYEYDPYGNILYETGSTYYINPYRFSTKYLDTETDLYYYGYRYYSPELGRWINRDPIAEEAFKSQRVAANGLNSSAFLRQSDNENLVLKGGGTNGVQPYVALADYLEALGQETGLYLFVDNDPVGAIDYLGLKKVKAIYVNQSRSVVIVKYLDGTQKTYLAATGNGSAYAGADADETGEVVSTHWGPVGTWQYSTVSWQQNQDNPFGPAMIKVKGTNSRHIHGTNGPMNGGIGYIGGPDPNKRKFTHGCARILNANIVKLKSDVDEKLNAGCGITVEFMH